MMDRNAAALVVVDLQERLLARIAGAGVVVAQTVKLIRVARDLSMPIVWTEQYPAGLGRTSPEVARELGGVSPLEKMSFGCFGEAAFAQALSRLGVNQLLITGVESHVCVLQTALGALEEGYEAYVVRDAVASRSNAEHVAALARMRSGGVTLVTAEMAAFELLRVAGTPEFKRVLPLLK